MRLHFKLQGLNYQKLGLRAPSHSSNAYIRNHTSLGPWRSETSRLRLRGQRRRAAHQELRLAAREVQQDTVQLVLQVLLTTSSLNSWEFRTFTKCRVTAACTHDSSNLANSMSRNKSVTEDGCCTFILGQRTVLESLKYGAE